LSNAELNVTITVPSAGAVVFKYITDFSEPAPGMF
jgi:hypothetical protein